MWNFWSKYIYRKSGHSTGNSFSNRASRSSRRNRVARHWQAVISALSDRASLWTTHKSSQEWARGQTMCRVLAFLRRSDREDGWSGICDDSETGRERSGGCFHGQVSGFFERRARIQLWSWVQKRSAEMVSGFLDNMARIKLEKYVLFFVFFSEFLESLLFVLTGNHFNHLPRNLRNFFTNGPIQL